MRFVLSAAVLLAAGLAEPQDSGTVLTVSEIQDPHLMRRPAVVEGRSWLGLRVLEDGSRLEQVEVRWLASVEFEDSLFRLSVEPQAPAFIVADVPQLSEGPTTTLSHYEQSLTAGSPLTFSLGALAYSVELSGSAPMMCDATVTVSDGTVSQDLYFPDTEPVSCDEPHFSIQWVGDLDGDGKLDLLATFSPKYSYYPRRLFLSTAAQDGELVGLVAVFDGSAA
ncbi:MAG: hypothetical protein KJO06_05875 [Gemmatimonadetes bacterium]|nr:hypothetical protein [Gemmatimonadota bacterium]